MTIALVRQASGPTSLAVTSLSATPPSATTTGNLLVLCIAIRSTTSNPISSISDTAMNMGWRQAAHTGSASFNRAAEIWYCANANSVTSVTATVGMTTTLVLELFEFSGAATTTTFDQMMGANNSGTAANSASTSTLTYTDEVMVAMIGAGGTPTFSSISPSLAGQTTVTSMVSGAQETMLSGYTLQGASTTGVSVSATLSASGNWAALVATFRTSSYGRGPTDTLSPAATSPVGTGTFGRSISDQLGTYAKAMLKGLADRNGEPSPTYTPAVSIYVVNVNWSDLQPTGTSDTLTGDMTARTGIYAIQDGISWAAANPGGQVKVRVSCGINAPGWAKAYQDTMASINSPFTVVDLNGQGPVYGSVGAWWNSSYLTACETLQSKLAAVYDATPQICEIVLSGASTVYAEPFQRQLEDPNAPAGINSPTIDILARANFNTTSDQAAINDMIGLTSTGVFKSTWLSLACNPYDGMTFNTGVATTGGSTTSLFDTTKMWTTNQWNTGGNQGAVFVNAAPPGDTVASHTGNKTINVNSTTLPSLTGWKLYVAGGVYTIASNTSSSITTSANIANIGDISTLHLNYAVGWAAAVAANTGDELTGLSPALPAAPDGLTYSVAVLSRDESYTASVMSTFRSNYPRAVLGNNSLKVSTTGSSQNGLYNDLVSAGPPLYFQTANDGAINGTSTTTNYPMLDTVNVAISFGASYVELPSGYDQSFDGTAASSTQTTVQNNLPGWSANEWGNGAGQLGRVVSGSDGGQVTSNTTDTLTLAGAGWHSTPPTVSSSFTVELWDYLSPADALVIAGALAAN